jgi:hypothetical protein
MMTGPRLLKVNQKTHSPSFPLHVDGKVRVLILTAPQKASPSSFGWGRTELLLFALMAI